MLEADLPLDEIESYIDGISGLPADARSALWLLAWAETDCRGRRVAVHELTESATHVLD